MIKIATFNVNSIKKRLPAVSAWLQKHQPDHLVLQELKCATEAFPKAEIAMLGYHARIVGQKTYNGVAILSKSLAKLRLDHLPGNAEDTQARYCEVEAQGLILAGLYLPNGNPVHDDAGNESVKFRYKLDWLDRLIVHADSLLREEKPVVITGDFNVIPSENDIYDASVWIGDALYHPEVHRRFMTLKHLGFWDAWRTLHPERRGYSFWDYQRGRWHKDEGIRIDHLLLSPQAVERLQAVEIDEVPRGKPEPSDHAPVWCTLSDEVKTR